MTNICEEITILKNNPLGTSRRSPLFKKISNVINIKVAIKRRGFDEKNLFIRPDRKVKFTLMETWLKLCYKEVSRAVISKSKPLDGTGF